MNPIHTDRAPKAIGPYSQAVQRNGWLFVSGQLGLDPDTGALEETFEEQVHRALENLRAILAAAGMGPERVAKATVYLADMDRFADFNSIYEKFFSPPFPAREVIQAVRLPKGGQVEISVIAV